jgi:Sigma-54 interaction domain
MGHPTPFFAGGSRTTPRGASPLPEHWRIARAAHVDLLLMGMPRVNLLLIAPDSVVRYVLESLLLDLREPVTAWWTGQPLALPSPDRIGTLVLHDVKSLPLDAQLDLLAWMEAADGRIQVVSATSTPLLPLVKSGAFIETLYYRLNTVCVDVTR